MCTKRGGCKLDRLAEAPGQADQHEGGADEQRPKEIREPEAFAIGEPANERARRGLREEADADTTGLRWPIE